MPTPPANGARRPPTGSSQGTAAGTSPGSHHDRRRAYHREAAAERRGTVPVSADRVVRVPLQLPHRRTRGPGRSDRLALHSLLRRAQHLRQPARPRGRLLPLRPVRDQPPSGSRLRAGQRFRLTTDMSLGIEVNRVRARHVLNAGDEAYCALSWDDEITPPQDAGEAKARIDATTRFWRAWLGRARIPDHRFRDEIQRSALPTK